MSLRHTSPARLLAPMAAVVLALGAAACSDDDEAAPDPPTTTSASGSETSDAEEDPSAPETEDTTADPDGTDDTEPPTTEAEPAGGLIDRLPDVEGYEREVDDDAALDDGYCDGSTPSVTPAEIAAAEYDDAGSDGDGSGDAGDDVEDKADDDTFYLAGLRFADDDDASTSYDELASTTAGCAAEEFSADEGTPADIGDEAVRFEYSDDDDGGFIYIARQDDVVWFYAHEVPAGAPAPAPEALTAFTATVEG